MDLVFSSLCPAADHSDVNRAKMVRALRGVPTGYEVVPSIQVLPSRIVYGGERGSLKTRLWGSFLTPVYWYGYL